MSIATTSRPAPPGIAVAKSAPRRRSLMQGALAVLLIVAGALTAAYVAQRMGSTHDFLGIARPVGRGAAITVDDLRVIRVNKALGLEAVSTSRSGDVIGKHAVMELVPGTLLTMAQVTDLPIPAPGHQLIGLALDEGQMPGSRLSVGHNVLLVVVPPKNQPIITTPNGSNSIDLVPPRTFAATVIDLTPGVKQGFTLINVEVTTADAPSVASLASEDRIVIALTGN